MKVRFVQSGGVAGAIRGCKLDSASLPREEARELDQLVRGSGFSASGEFLSDAARDLQQYEIVIEDGNRTTEIVVDDATVPDSAKRLVGFLRRHAGPMEKIRLGVYREVGPRTALELHNLRRAALHAILDDEDGKRTIKILDWGQTDDAVPHEYVEVLISVLGPVVLHYAIFPALKHVGEKLVEKAVEEGASEFAKWLISKLMPKQADKKIGGFTIHLPDRTCIHVQPPDGGATINITFAGGSQSSVGYQSHPSSNAQPQSSANRG